MPFSNLTPTSTFTQWYTQTNEISTFLNEQIVANGQVAYGAFELGSNASLNVCNVVTINSDAFSAVVNTTVGNSTTGFVAVLGDLFTVTSNVVLLNPISSVLVNTALTVNATSNFVGNAAFANVVVGGTLVGINARFDGGTITANNGTFVGRNLSFTTNGATVNSTLAAAGYSDYTVSGLENATTWSASPSQNTVVSGLDAHATVSTSVDGSRILFLQNLSASYTIRLSAANTSSTAIHRFETVGSLPVDVAPLQTVLLHYAKETQRWRIVGGAQTTGGSGIFGNTTINGWLSVSGNTTLSANVVAAPLYVNSVTGRVGIGTAAPTVKFHSIGPNTLEDITIADTLRSSTLVVSGGANLATANIQFAANGVARFDNIINVTALGQSYVANLRSGSLAVDAGITAVTVGAVTGAFSGTVSGAVGTFTALNAGVADGSGDGAIDRTLVTKSGGVVKYLTGFTGSRFISTDDGFKTFTWKAGVLLSVSA